MLGSVSAASKSRVKSPLPKPLITWPAASSARVCVPDSTVTNAASGSVFPLPSSLYVKTCGATLVTVSR